MAEFLAAHGNLGSEAISPQLDLREIEIAERATKWHGAVTDSFPGLSLRLNPAVPALGSIKRFRMGGGELFAIESAPVEVSYRPERTSLKPQHLSLMMQTRGSVAINHGGRQVEMAEGDLCLIDEASPFQMTGRDSSGILFLRIPRTAALSRHPQIDRLIAQAMPSDETGTRMLGDNLLRLLQDADRLHDLQRAVMMDAMLQMLAVAGPFSGAAATVDWRITRALEFIELNLATSGLAADDVAQEQNISRRRLDQLMHKAIGQSISGQLWSRRLERAAADLRDPRCARMTAAQIAFANGFEDAAHFTRAFKRHYACTPGQWRLN